MATAESTLNPNERNERLWRRSYTNQDDNQLYDYDHNEDNSEVNVNTTERIASGVGGGVLAAYGLSRGDWLGYGLAALGGMLVHRGATGYCNMYGALGINTAETDSYERRGLHQQGGSSDQYTERHVSSQENEGGMSNLSSLLGLALMATGGTLVYRGMTGGQSSNRATGRRSYENVSVRGDRGVKVEKAVTINASAEELYSFWRRFENLPKFMDHLESVKELDNNRSHWKAKAPLGTTVEWDAEIISDTPNEMISWRSVENSDVPNAGSVHFEQAPAGRGTVIRVSLSYEPPAGKLGEWVAWLFGEEPSVQVEEDLRRFKRLMETDEIPTVEGQTSGRASQAKRASI